MYIEFTFIRRVLLARNILKLGRHTVRLSCRICIPDCRGNMLFPSTVSGNGEDMKSRRLVVRSIIAARHGGITKKDRARVGR